jgi:hypothetical protein
MTNRIVLCAAFLIAWFGASTVFAAGILYEAFLDGPSESPPVASPGTGYALVELDVVAHTLSVQVWFSDLIGTTTLSHIHAPTVDPFELTAGVASATPSFVGFPVGVTGGSYFHVYDTSLASSFNPAYVTAFSGTVAGAEAALATQLAEGRAYLNIHSSLFGGGEIRGFLTPVPEPATWTLAVLGILGLASIHRRRRR